MQSCEKRKKNVAKKVQLIVNTSVLYRYSVPNVFLKYCSKGTVLKMFNWSQPALSERFSLLL